MKEVIRTTNSYSLSIEELAMRQIGMNNRHQVQGGVAYARKKINEQKNIARGRVVSLFKKARWGKGLSILTMPGIYWTFEKRLLGVREGNWQCRTRPARSTHITAVEIDPGLFSAGVLEMPRKPQAAIVHYTQSPDWTARTVGTDAIARFHNCDVYALMDQNRKHFNAAWLDFTGCMSPLTIDRIGDFYAEWITDILILTFLDARQSAAASLEIEEAGSTPNWIRHHLPGKQLHTLRYHDGVTSMVQFAIAKEDSNYVY